MEMPRDAALFPTDLPNKIPVIVRVPWDKEKNIFDPQPLKTIDTEYAAEYDVRGLVEDAPAQVKCKPR